MGALPAKLFLTKPMYFNALKSGGAMILYHQKEARASRFLLRKTQIIHEINEMERSFIFMKTHFRYVGVIRTMVYV